MKTVNVQSLSDKAKNYARKNNCTPQQAMQYFAFCWNTICVDKFLKELKDNKGYSSKTRTITK